MTAPRPTIAVVGVGGVGGIFAAALAASGRTVTACTRRPLPRLTLTRGETTVEAGLANLTDPAEVAGPADWVILATKAQDTEAVAPWLGALAGKGTRVAVLQNGIDHLARVAPLAPGAEILPVLVYYNAERLAPDHVRYRRAGPCDLVVPKGEAGAAFAALAAEAGFVTAEDSDFRTLAWRKLLLNAIANPATALTGERQWIFRRGDIQDLCRAILAEAAAVGRADGADLGPETEAETLRILLTYPPEAGTSMYFDRMGGKRLEAEALTGAIVRIGKERGVATPVNGMLLALLRAVDEGVGRRAG